MKDFEELLKARVSEGFLRDLLAEERTLARRHVSEMIEFRAEEAARRHEGAAMELRRVREDLGDQIDLMCKAAEEKAQRYV